jgi:DNA-directed RNA polymerase subunit L
MVEVSNEDFTYCVLLPERIEGNKYVESKAFGIGPSSDSTSVYDKIFHLNTDLYKVLSMCIYEVSKI